MCKPLTQDTLGDLTYIFSNQKVGKIKQKKKQNYDLIQCLYQEFLFPIKRSKTPEIHIKNMILYQEKVCKKVQKPLQKHDPIRRILTFSKGPEIHANLFLVVVKHFKYGKRFRFAPSFNNRYILGLRTPNEGINQRNLKIWADVADKICFGRT